MTTPKEVEQFERDGYLIVEQFLSNEETASLRNSCHQIVEDMDPAEHNKVIFAAGKEEQDHTKSTYFLDSGDKVRFFFEEEALNEKGEVLTAKHKSLNKIGHALHWLVPEFKKVTFSKKVQTIAKNMGYVDPKVIQSMYIFKQPKIGGVVPPHQDSSFLCNKPLKLFGLWIALEDCTTTNGCLQFVPGSHKTHPVTISMRRNDDGVGTYFTEPLKYPNLNPEEFVTAEVKAGSLILIDGKVIHKSEPNKSEKSRHIYTFHVIENHQSEWEKWCWLQPTESLPFPSLYGVS